MYVTITASKGRSGEQAKRVHNFLNGFLSRLKEQPGVKEILHGASPRRNRRNDRDRLGDCR
jgi:hypothetical protein